jgi:hypothetical protein
MASMTTHVPRSRLSGSRVEAVHPSADQRGVTASGAVRSALRTPMALDPPTRQYATLLYEVAKTRAVWLRLLDTQLPKSQADQLLSLAEGEATEYVREH